MHFVKNLTTNIMQSITKSRATSRLDFRSSIKGWHLAFSHANVDQRRVSKGKENNKKKKKEKKSGLAVTLQRESIEHGGISRVQRL